MTRGKSFHSKLLEFWKKRYSPTTRSPKGHEEAKETRKRVKTHSDMTIYELVKTSDPSVDDRQEEVWVEDKEKEFDKVMEEVVQYI